MFFGKEVSKEAGAVSPPESAGCGESPSRQRFPVVDVFWLDGIHDFASKPPYTAP